MASSSRRDPRGHASSTRRGIPLIFNHICERSEGCDINPRCSASRRSENRTLTDTAHQLLTLLNFVRSCRGGNCRDGAFAFSYARDERQTSHSQEQLGFFWQAMINDLAKRDFRAKHPESGSVDIQILSAQITWTRSSDFPRRHGTHSNDATLEHLAMGAKYDVIRYVTVDYCTRPHSLVFVSRQRSAKSTKVSDADVKSSKPKAIKPPIECPYQKWVGR
ncbi:hypothetical protein F5Y18DRAFT_428160 [Xylariaceae sp. FL1019]|nr:hypothetical protein F5Y18DRAFT_428160 [Xylariaceae sp. FL1019]